ncbi:hypothetical protein M3Y96_00826000 [Aphelenchoides besseyi]|nr:hypothetical protein M3Y96_00826000 [Aphelenchoides besseyi]
MSEIIASNGSSDKRNSVIYPNCKIDSKIKKELIDEINKLKIKNENKVEDFVSVMVSTFASFRISGGIIESNIAGDVDGDAGGLTIKLDSSHNNETYEFLHRGMTFGIGQMVPGNPVVLTLEDVILQLFDVNHHPININCTLTLNFVSWDLANEFGQRLLEAGYNQL